jgi:hypothetical protein
MGVCGPPKAMSVAKRRDLQFFCSIRTEVSSRPKRTRISCHAALDMTTCAPFRKEGRMKCTNATRFHRKSGGA